MIGIGINENVYLKGALLNDKSTLELTFDQAGAADVPPPSFFDTIAAAGVVEMGGTANTIRLFPPLPPRADSDKTPEKQAELLTGDINKTKAILLHLLRGYYTIEELTAAEAMNLDVFRGLELDRNNYNEKILNGEVLKQIHENMCKKFIQVITPKLNNKTELFRLLLVRQSKEKHFPTFRGKYLEENPFYESMLVPKEQSKVAFTNYEKTNGLDSAKPFEKPAAEAGQNGNTAPLDPASVFSN